MRVLLGSTALVLGLLALLCLTGLAALVLAGLAALVLGSLAALRLAALRLTALALAALGLMLAQQFPCLVSELLEIWHRYPRHMMRRQ